MKAVKITVDVPPKYVNAVEDRVFLKVGQKLTGTVVLDSPGRPKSCEVRWLDVRGRLLGRTEGKYDAYQRRMTYEFDLNQNPFWVHFIECSIDGVVQPIREKFFVSPTSQGWETSPAITWATYPFGDFYDRLMEVGVNGIIAYGMAPFDHVVENAMRFYVDQCTFWEISTYHRPFRQFWEPPADYKGTVSPQSPGFGHNWKALQERYVRVRERCRKEGRFLSRDDHYRKVLHRAWCPNDPGTLRDAGERFEAVVRQHKGFRPLFQNIADEAGITDQSKPFDFCYCHYCMDKFRVKLEGRYGSLDELNRQWGTAFATWNDVYPLTCDETMDANATAARKGGPWNFASWADHREFMDDTFAEFFEQMRRVGRKVDPIGTYSQGGCQDPTIYGGWDYAKVVRTVDALIPYNIGGNQELIRSFAPPGVKNLSPFFGDDELQVRQMWFSILHGDAGVIFWDADGPNGRFVVRPSGKISHRGRLFGPALREFRGGFAQQFAAWGRADDPIGVLYSQPSERAHWMLEAIDGRKQKEWFLRYELIRYTNTRMSWQKLIEDLQLQYRYISYLDVDEGKIDLSQFKIIVLPQSLALSAAQVKALRQFVHDGGVLVADGRVGRFDDNCRQVECGLLDDLFGVRHGKELTLKVGSKLSAAGRAGQRWADLGKEIGTIAALDKSVRLADGGGAESAAKAGPAAALVRRRVGKGWAVYLNVDVNRYQIDRHEIDLPRGKALRAMLDAVVALAGIERTVRVDDRTLGTAVGIELTRFEQGGAEMAALLMNRQFRSSGVGETIKDQTLASFETDRKLAVGFADPGHVYNARTGEYLGRTDGVTQTLPRLTPLILSRLPYRVGGLEVRMPARVTAGEPVAVELELQTDGPTVEHVINVEVYKPDGTWCHWYSGNVTACDGRARMTVPLALNDPAGAWKVVARDAVTGIRAEKTLRVSKA